jgi:hypothetical protein
MKESEAFHAQQEAVAELETYPERATPHEEGLRRFLGGVAYRQARRSKADAEERAGRERAQRAAST